VLKSSPEASEQQVAFLRPGAIFGEMSFFDPAPHSATIRVVEDAEFLFFSTEAYQKLEFLAPGAAHKFVKNMGRILAQKLRRTDSRLVNEMFTYSQRVSDLETVAAE
jgi:CRP-like cAMP-binding protein